MPTSFPPWTEEHEMIRRTVRQFTEERLYPTARSGTSRVTARTRAVQRDG